MCNKSEKKCCYWFSILCLKFVILYHLDFYILFDAKFMRLESEWVLKGELSGSCEPIEKLISINDKIRPILDEVAISPFFNAFKMKSGEECPFWAQ